VTSRRNEREGNIVERKARRQTVRSVCGVNDAWAGKRNIEEAVGRTKRRREEERKDGNRQVTRKNNERAQKGKSTVTKVEITRRGIGDKSED